jgi:hypothetical protein
MNRDTSYSEVVLETSCLLISCTEALAGYSVCLRIARLWVLALCASIQTCSEQAFVEGLSSILALGYRVSPRSSPHCLTIMCDSKDEIERSEEMASQVFALP